jgi:hypothetical protein
VCIARVCIARVCITRVRVACAVLSTSSHAAELFSTSAIGWSITSNALQARHVRT